MAMILTPRELQDGELKEGIKELEEIEESLRNTEATASIIDEKKIIEMMEKYYSLNESIKMVQK